MDLCNFVLAVIVQICLSSFPCTRRTKVLKMQPSVTCTQISAGDWGLLDSVCSGVLRLVCCCISSDTLQYHIATMIVVIAV